MNKKLPLILESKQKQRQKTTKRKQKRKQQQEGQAINSTRIVAPVCETQYFIQNRVE